ncbi:(2Fe-2S)-binding protein [Alkalimarinus alittae]|uniref:Bacterioferritin-associated ferredoxin n=1 Tax=Alkalimarinus alittae TaxID=2961619 RepID=A0ABY6N4L8_9ALTE|nr:(2Fe-2S)-binding protein [Alkalimarinus alittae]UZE97053.1 (2Fe-2S)-binding protein [Alkalimarinus alittae]
MLVCICKGISDKDIESAVHEGATGFGDVRASLGVGGCCGQCASYAKDLVKDTISQLQLSQALHLAQEVSC